MTQRSTSPTSRIESPNEWPLRAADEILPTEVAQELLATAEKHHVRFPIPDGFLGLGEWLRRPLFVMAGADGAMQSAAIWVVLALVAAALF